MAENKNCSDEYLCRCMLENLRQTEGEVLYPYLDTKGNITVGIGENIDDLQAFLNTEFKINGRAALREEKQHFYEVLKNLNKNGNLKAEAYQNKTPLTISKNLAEKMLKQHLKADMAFLKTQFTDFDVFPQALKEVLLDIEYNTGGLTRARWPKLYEAVEKKNLEGVKKETRRKNLPKRNAWTRKRLEDPDLYPFFLR